MIFLLDQIKTFFSMLLFGFFSGFIFNIYQIILHRFRFKRFIIHIFDIVFSVLLGVSGFILLIYINNGSLRFYVILAITIGFLIYNSIVHRIRKTGLG